MGSVSSLNSLLSSSSTSSTSSSSIDLSSLLSAATGATSTGIDVTSAVAAAIYAAQAPERQWQAQQATIKSQITALTSVQTALTSLSTDLNNLGDLNGPLAARSVTSSSSAVTATATNGAAVGSHTVAVNNLATAASWYSPAVSNASASLGSMQIQITGANGTTNSFNANGTTTLTQLVNTINASGAGVTASVVTDATGARLALVGSNTGAANDFSVGFSAVTGSTWNSTSVASASTPLTAGSFQVGDGTNTTTIAVSSGDTLASVASRINSAGLNVSASVTTDSNGAHLSLAATNSATLSTVGDPAFAPTRASQAVNASLTVDGVPISSATNTVAGAANGLTLNLSGTTSTPASLSVLADQSQISTAVSSFVNDYNSALSLVNSQFTYDSTSGSQGVLSGDATLRSLQSSLMSAISYNAPNSTSGAAAINPTLASLGISMNDDGSLSLNSDTLSQAVSSNSAAVQNFFQGNALNGFAQTFTTSLQTFTSPSNGALTTSMNNLNTTYTSLQSQVDDYESGYIASQKTVLTAMYSKAEIALQSLPATLKQLQAQLGENSGS